MFGIHNYEKFSAKYGSFDYERYRKHLPALGKAMVSMRSRVKELTLDKKYWRHHDLASLIRYCYNYVMMEAVDGNYTEKKYCTSRFFLENHVEVERILYSIYYELEGKRKNEK